MVNKYCHRYLISFDRDGRMIIHLLKKKQCKITNPNYDAKYEKQLLLLLEQENYNIDIDSEKHIIEVIDTISNRIIYQCNLCLHKLPNKSYMVRHVMESCLCTKYTRYYFIKLEIQS